MLPCFLCVYRIWTNGSLFVTAGLKQGLDCKIVYVFVCVCVGVCVWRLVSVVLALETLFPNWVNAETLSWGGEKAKTPLGVLPTKQPQGCRSIAFQWIPSCYILGKITGMEGLVTGGLLRRVGDRILMGIPLGWGKWVSHLFTIVSTCPATHLQTCLVPEGNWVYNHGSE